VKCCCRLPVWQLHHWTDGHVAERDGTHPVELRRVWPVSRWGRRRCYRLSRVQVQRATSQISHRADGYRPPSELLWDQRLHSQYVVSTITFALLFTSTTDDTKTNKNLIPSSLINVKNLTVLYHWVWAYAGNFGHMGALAHLLCFATWSTLKACKSSFLHVVGLPRRTWSLIVVR